MQRGETEPSIKFTAVPGDCGDNIQKLIHQHHHCDSSVLLGTTRKRHSKFSNAPKKPFWFTSRRSKIKLPTRFLLGGTINDPLNLQGLESEVCSCKMQSQELTPKHSYRIGIPHVTDASDPLNLKNVSAEEPESLSNNIITDVEKRKNACSKNHCKGAYVTDEALHRLLFDANEDGSEQQYLCMDSSVDVKEKVYYHNYSFSINDRKTDNVPVEAACEITNNVSDEHMSSVVGETEAVSYRHSNKIASHEKIVSPAVPQFSHYRARKRQRRSARACKEANPSLRSSHKSVCKKTKEKFQCGNYVAYYGYRNVDGVKDARLKLLPKELFEGKEVLDIGCNAGIITIAVASTCLPKRILGIDVDQRLIGLAKQNVRRYMDKSSYPSCLKTAFGPIAASVLPLAECSAFPHNILFQLGDYVPSSDADLSRQREEYDVILALSVTKWIHLTQGDVGLKRAFRRMFLQLRPGGQLVLEAQPWASYKRKKKLTEKIFAVYQSICFKPEQFNDYLMSAEVGFSCCKLLGTPLHKAKGFQRSIYLFTKAETAAMISST